MNNVSITLYVALCAVGSFMADVMHFQATIIFLNVAHHLYITFDFQSYLCTRNLAYYVKIQLGHLLCFSNMMESIQRPAIMYIAARG